MLTITIEERETVSKIISKNKICFVGMIDKDGMPHVIPMNFGFDNDTIYLHSGTEGGSVEALKSNPNVCITLCSETELVYQNEQVACSYRMSGSSVICKGKVEFEENHEEKIKALDIIMKQYTDKAFTYSEPAVRNVLIWKVKPETISTKVYGVPHQNSRKHCHNPLD